MRGFIIAIILLAVASASAPLHAAPVVELSQDQLRTAVSSKSVINPRRVYAAVESQMNSKPVDIRVFKSKRVYYRVLVKNSNGKMSSIIVDAKSGTLVSKRSSIARKINDAASEITAVVQVSSTDSEGSSPGGGGSGVGGGGSGGYGDDDDDDQGDDDDDDQGGNDQGGNDQGVNEQ